MRALSEQEKRILAMIEPEADALGLDIVRVRIGGSRTPVLQIMAERKGGGMDVTDCARLSRRLSPLLDERDPIDGEYTLEVSSPGIDRPLTRPGDFAPWAGHEVRVELEMPVDGRRRFHGFIAGEEGGVVTLNLKDGGEAKIAVADMVKAHLVMTDRLIEEATARGDLEPDPDDDAFDEVEVDGDDDEDDEDDDEDLEDGATRETSANAADADPHQKE